ncbi:MAG: hypothetical protein ABJA98_20415 [Acidobacteriota bacterium]
MTTAIIQVPVMIAAARAARRVERLVDRIEHELAPTFGHINAIGRDASRAVALAAVQVERVEGLISDLAQRVEEVVAIVQTTVAAPAREGKAILLALRAAMEVVRDARRRSRARRRAEDDDVLFI